mgnify:FL=1
MKKIPTLFERVFEGHKIVDILPNIMPGCEEAFLHGEATIKYDGSCCAVIDGEFYKRYGAKKGKTIPEGAIPCQEEPDPVTGHFPCWVKCNRENPQDKWFWAAYDQYSEACDKPFDGTYEAIGKHFNGNPYYRDDDVLVKHGASYIFNLDRTFEGVREYLRTTDIEGIVFWLDDKPVCKIKRSDFGFEWPVYIVTINREG